MAPLPPSDESIAAMDTEALARWAAQSPPADVAGALAAREPDARVPVLERLPRETWPAIFRHLPCDVQAGIVSALDRVRARALLDALDTDDRTYFFEQLPESEREAALELLGVDARRETQRMLAYPADSVGRLMSLAFAAVQPAWPAGKALESIRQHQLDPDKVSTIFVVDERDMLVDVLTLARLALAHPDTPVRDVMDGIYVAISPLEDREQAALLMQKHDLLALPVADDSGRLVGVISVDDAMEVAEEETTEDIHRQAGIEPLRATYPDISATVLFRKRLPWLAALIFVYLGASGVISAFEEALAAEIVLAAFIPLLMGSGGNVGAQSGTLIVRALAVGELAAGRWVGALRKEVAVGVALGVALGLLAGVVAYFRGGGDIAVVVGASMVIIVIAANLTGTLLPVLLDKIGVDPAVAGSPVITSVTDLTSLLIYLGIASRVLTI